MGVIGPNGAGKTTIFNLITGFTAPTHGEIFFEDQKISGLKSYEIARKGIFRTFQTVHLFPELTVLENILVGAQLHLESNLLSTALDLPSFRNREARINERARSVLELFNIANLSDSVAGDLAYGTQRILEIARAVAAGPKLILLDEPVAGMNYEESSILAQTLRRVKQQRDVTIVLVEHDMGFVMNLCDRLVVMNYGKRIATGTPDEIKSNPEVVEAYLGSEKAC